MKSLIIIFLASATEVFTGRIDHFSQTHKEASVSSSEAPQRVPTNYAYKEVILYLTASEIRALESQNILKRNHDGSSMYLVNSQIPYHKQGETIPKTFDKSQNIKPVEELQEDTPLPSKQNLIHVPLFYPFQLIPLKDIEHEKSHNVEWIRNQERLHKFEHQSSWTPILGKPNTAMVPTYNKEEDALDNLFRLQYTTNNYNNANTLRVEDLHRLQHEFEEQLALGYRSYPFSNKVSLSNADIPATKLPAFSRLNHHSIEGYLYPKSLRIIRPLSKEESSDNTDEIGKQHDLYEPETITNINRSFQSQIAYVDKKKASETH